MLREVEFHTGVDDKLVFACRLLRKAYSKGPQVAVVGDAESIGRLDTLLWTFEPHAFVPHGRLVADEVPARHLRRTRLWLLDPGAASPHREVLVNLGADLAVDFDAFGRVIEVVSQAPQDRDAGRRRWRQYEARGLRVTHHQQKATG